MINIPDFRPDGLQLEEHRRAQRVGLDDVFEAATRAHRVENPSEIKAAGPEVGGSTSIVKLRSDSASDWIV